MGSIRNNVKKMRQGRSRDGKCKSRKRKPTTETPGKDPTLQHIKDILNSPCSTLLRQRVEDPIDAEILSVVKDEDLSLVNDVCILSGEDVRIIEDEVYDLTEDVSEERVQAFVGSLYKEKSSLFGIRKGTGACRWTIYRSDRKLSVVSCHCISEMQHFLLQIRSTVQFHIFFLKIAETDRN